MLSAYERWHNDFFMERTYGDPPVPVTMDERVAAYEKQTTTSAAHWFVSYEIDGWRPIGRTDIVDIDWRNRSAGYGVMIGETDARGRGYSTETTRLMPDDAFTDLGLRSAMLDVSG